MTTPTENLTRFDAFTAAAILAIPLGEPERLFTGNTDALKDEYRYLARLWHPDLNKAAEATDVSMHLNQLRGRAEEKLGKGKWEIPGELTFNLVDGKQKRLKYKKKFSFELGEGYISQGYVTYVVAPEHKALYDNAIKVIKGFDFPNNKVREEFTKYLPKVVSNFDSKEGFVLVLEKTPEVVRLRDLLDYEKGFLDPKHAAWILSSLHNLSCYLSWANLTHNDISPDTYFISPQHHSGVLMGGWWYAASKDAALRALPNRTFDAAPPDVIRNGKADPRVDLGLIRLTGRELLGDAGSTSIHVSKKIPEAMAEWLRQPSSGDAREDYKAWTDNVLQESFGPRRFVEMKTSFSDIYEQKGGKPWVPPSPDPGTPSPAPPRKKSRRGPATTAAPL